MIGWMHRVAYLLRAQEGSFLSSWGTRALIRARLEIGNGETESNNRGPDVTKYRGRDGSGAWCASFVSWVMREASLGEPWDLLRVTQDYWDRKRHVAKKLFEMVGKAGCFVTHPGSGDLVCWERGKDGDWQGHVGFVDRIEAGILHTIEGNVGRFPSLVRPFSYQLDRPGRLIGYARLP